MASWLGPVVAERELERASGGKRACGFRIGRPRKAREGDYECRYEIFGFGKRRRMRVFGIDEVQALDLTFTALRADLQQLEGEALWLGEPAHHGVPLSVPMYLPRKYARRVEGALERANASFAKEARRAHREKR